MRKKIILSSAAVLAAFVSFGQQTVQTTAPAPAPEETKTTVEDVLPVQGEIGLTIGAGSALNYLGNFFGKSANNVYGSSIFDYPTKNLPTTVIAIKYFVSDKTAIRVAANLMYGSTTQFYEVQDDRELDPDAKLYDEVHTKTSGYTVAAGFEKRVGESRLQGIFGAEAYIGNPGTASYEVEYGNQFSQVNQAPTVSGGVNGHMKKNNRLSQNITDPSWRYRLVEENITSNFAVGARAIIGVEYFVTKKISLGGEFLWGLEYRKLGKQSCTWEYYNSVLNEVATETNESKVGKSFQVGPSNLNGSLSLNFYF